ISSKKLGETAEGHLLNQHQFQGTYSEMDEDIGWNDFTLRNYDPQVGRWVQQDPYQQFASPYVGMGGDPVNLIDPSGGFSMTGMAAGAVLGGMVGGVIDMVSGGSGGRGFLTGMAMGAAIGSGTGLGTMTNTVLQSANAVSQTISQAGAAKQAGNVQAANYQYVNTAFHNSNELDWKDLYKEDLKVIYREKNGREGTEYELGIYLEDRLNEVFRKKGGQMVRNRELYTDAGDRNTKPDFTGPATYLDFSKRRYVPVPGAAAVEVKQSKRRGLYLSSNDYQIKGHIDNLRARFAAEYRHPNFRAGLLLVTTADVKPSPSMAKYANDQQVNFAHLHAEYAVERLQNRRTIWHFRFTKIAQ
ncbi:hypothetical protein HRH25_23650, partial [Flavisolibacter sp. BT320]|nr:hypothetical protein [Flavisolibacter longurius]